MSAKPHTTTDAPAANELNDDDALRVASGLTAYRFVRVEDFSTMLDPSSAFDRSAKAAEIASFMHPRGLVASHVVAEVDEYGLGRPTPDEWQTTPATRRVRFEIPEVDDDETELTVAVTEKWTNRYDDVRVEVETPAPWDTPDDMTPANDLIKSLPWGDDEADDGETPAHYKFDESREAWVIDAAAVDDLADVVTEAGYTFVAFDDAAADDESDVEQTEAVETFAAALEAAENGDRVTLTYEKANGNGLAEKTGDVETLTEFTNDRMTPGLVIRRDDGNVTKTRLDDDDVPAVFSKGRYPYMGRLVAVDIN